MGKIENSRGKINPTNKKILIPGVVAAVNSGVDLQEIARELSEMHPDDQAVVEKIAEVAQKMLSYI